MSFDKTSGCWARCAWVLGVVALTVACGGGSDTPADSGAPPDAGTIVDTGVPDTGTPDSGRPDAGRADAAPRDAETPDAGGDGNEAFADAVELVIGNGAGAQGVIDVIGDVDYFKLAGTPGTFLLIATTGESAGVDTVVTVYDSLMTKVAENDDLQPRTGTDSQIVYHLSSADTYYLTVEDFRSWADVADPIGGPDFRYSISALPLADAANGVNVDQEAGNDAVSAQTVDFGRNSTFILGTWVDPADVDVYRMTITGSSTRLGSMLVLGAGPDANGSTSAAGHVSLTDATGAVVLARVDNSLGLPRIAMPITGGTYLLWVAHPGAALGANDFYVVKPTFGTENPAEVAEGMNDDVMGAEVLAVEALDATTRAGFLLSVLGDGDVDYWSFDVQTDEQINVFCTSAAAGAGIVDLGGQVLGADLTPIAMATETVPDGLAISELVPTSTGTHYLRLSKGAQDPVVTSEFARCGVTLVKP
ncbi:PPC domain-containing protein [Myxococcota bacterium]|nr:PPC domain-containing protein [Myxococcota bacterium]